MKAEKKFIWSNLNKGICAYCDEILEFDKEIQMVYCKYCFFKVRISRYMDLIKGKESIVYKNKVKRIEKIKVFNKKKKENIKKVIKIQNDERLFNLNKMLRKGIITKEEYDLKLTCE